MPAEDMNPAGRDADPVIVVGAGPTGLSAAYHLGAESLLVEREARVGGWCRSLEDNGFTFDFAGHIMFSTDPYVHELYQLLLGDNVHWQDREAWIYSKQVYTRYPFQGSLYGLPADVIKECIIGAIEARYGVEKKSPSPPDARSVPRTAPPTYGCGTCCCSPAPPSSSASPRARWPSPRRTRRRASSSAARSAPSRLSRSASRTATSTCSGSG